MPALLPYLHHIQPASAHLLHHVATATQQAKQLAAVLHTSSQVTIVTLQVLHSPLVLVRLMAAEQLACFLKLKVGTLCWLALLLGHALLCVTCVQPAE